MEKKFLIIFLLFIIGCEHPRQVFKPTEVDKGWKAFNYPRTTMPPGYVFRIAEGDNVPHEVKILRTNKPFDTGYAVLPKTFTDKRLTAGALARFLFLNSDDSNVVAGLNSSKAVSYEIGQGFLEAIDEPTVDSLVKNSDISWRDNNTYYIIQGTLSTKSIKYTAKSKLDINARAILNFKAVSGGAHFSIENRDSTILIEDFDQRYRVYYIAWKINAMGATSANNKIFTYNKNPEGKIIQD